MGDAQGYLELVDNWDGLGEERMRGDWDIFLIASSSRIVGAFRGLVISDVSFAVAANAVSGVAI